MIENRAFQKALANRFRAVGLIPAGKGVAAAYFKLPAPGYLNIEVTVSEPVAAGDLPSKYCVAFSVDAAVRIPELDGWIANILSKTSYDGWCSPIAMRGGHLLKGSYLNIATGFENSNELSVSEALVNEYLKSVHPRWLAIANSTPLDVLGFEGLGVGIGICLSRMIAMLAVAPAWGAGYCLEEVDRRLLAFNEAIPIPVDRITDFASQSHRRLSDILSILRGAITKQ